ncbi:hypothetical protein LOTGIDRAFT_232703 [Lottia gigantea]|uniref:Ashwin n=1 Tax=Lottia gigantea TaxID=225164 RepID=V3ZPC0_LOTGI|nr:hypothetical protein LOTGIDRAFT_232703 [Lottia gigantea]ESO93253.1 hypothetical protein LOTGIDRAFT_232703 [Lottia gigantea]
MAAPTENTADFLLYPELLTEDGLRLLFRQRYIEEKGIENYDKEDLLKLYYKYFLPLPQRKYRSNRHGREMTKKQVLLAKKRKLNGSEEEIPIKKRRSTGSQLITPLDKSSSTSTRLKPPPTCIDFNKKVIKLSSSPSNVSEQMTEINSKVKKLSTKPMKFDRDPAVNSLTIVNKHVSNKFPQEQGNGEECMDIDTEDKVEQEKQPKKKIKKISWP